MLDIVVLFFILGFLAKLLKSDLRLPEPLYETLSIYLLLAIGLKGGIELSKQSLAAMLPQISACVALGAVIPLLLSPILRRVVGLSAVDSAALAAHFGSVSVVTFAVGSAYLNQQGIAFEPHAALWVAVMEAPGIITGILLARFHLARAQLASVHQSSAHSNSHRDNAPNPAPAGAAPWGTLLHEVLFGKSVLLLLGGLVIGATMGEQGAAPIMPLFGGLFKGVLALFLLELGLVAGARVADMRRYGAALAVFGVLAPLGLAVCGAVTGWLLGLSIGGTALLATLTASASYIAAPTALRVAVPQANAGLSITVAIGIAFPFNIVIGIPLYLKLAQWLHAA